MFVHKYGWCCSLGFGPGEEVIVEFHGRIRCGSRQRKTRYSRFRWRLHDTLINLTLRERRHGFDMSDEHFQTSIPRIRLTLYNQQFIGSSLVIRMDDSVVSV